MSFSLQKLFQFAFSLQTLHAKPNARRQHISSACRASKLTSYLIEFDNVGVIQKLHYLHFSINLLQIAGV